MSEDLNYDIPSMEDTMPERPSRIHYIDVLGFKVPYRPSGYITECDSKTGQRISKDIKPAYAVFWEAFNKAIADPNQGFPFSSFKNASLSTIREIPMECVRAMAWKHKGYEAPTAVSAGVPVNCVYVDEHCGRIILNEWQATQRYIDADGDRAIMLYNKEGDKAELVKWPITSQPLILEVMKTPPQEKFYDFGSAEAFVTKEKHPVKRIGSGYDEYELFVKRHKDVQVGLMTSAWNCFDLFKSKAMPFQERMEYIYNSFIDSETGKTQRALDIEDTGMKAVRKDGKSFQKAFVLEYGAGWALSNDTAWALTSCSTIGKMNKQLSWVRDVDLKKKVQSILDLRVGFRKVRPSVNKEDTPRFVEEGFFDRLVACKKISWGEIEHTDPNMPACVMLTLTHKGQVVGLTDVKRDGRQEGFTYGFLLAPVFDNVTILNEDGEVAIPPSRTWVHPIAHLKKMLSTFDSSIKKSGHIDHYFLQGVVNGKSCAMPDEWELDSRAVKISMLYKWLLDYAGKYGDPAPCIKTPLGPKPTNEAASTIAASVVIDYGTSAHEDDMYRVAKLAKQTCNFCIVGSKSTSRRIRKYMLANEYGGSIFDYKGLCHPYRGAMNRAQLIRSLASVKMKVAIVKMDTMNQILITPSGVKKQEISNAFFPQVFGTREEYQEFLKMHNWTESECPCEETYYYTWTGAQRVCWTIGARKAIKVGKLVDLVGNKFVPRTIGQAKAFKPGQELIDIDLIFPINELVDKDTHHLFLSNAEEVDLEVCGQQVKAMLVERTFFRTGSASENIPARHRMCAFKGIDSFPIFHRFTKIEPDTKPRGENIDLSMALELQQALRSIFNHIKPPSEDYYPEEDSLE